MPWKPSKVGQGDLVSGLWRPLTNTSLFAGFQVSMSSGYDLWQHLTSQTDRQTHRQTVLYRVHEQLMNSSAGWLASWANNNNDSVIIPFFSTWSEGYYSFNVRQLFAVILPPGLQHCWLGDKKGIRPVKTSAPLVPGVSLWHRPTFWNPV